MSRSTLTDWEPDDAAFWQASGRRIARRNMWTSVFAEHIGFSVWSLWSVLVLFMSAKTGSTLSPGDKFLIVCVATAAGSAVRPGYGFAVTRLGGRTWTTLSALLLLVPVAAAIIVLGHKNPPLWELLACAAVSGLGGGSFASSTTNINFFFPEREKGRALGINAGGGNLGVASVQLLGLLVIATAGTGHPRLLAALFIPLLLVSACLAYARMDNLPGMRTDGRLYRTALTDPHCWTISLLYIGTFGSFIGYSAAMPLLMKTAFPSVNTLEFAFLGPLVGSLARPAGGWLSDRLGGAPVTFGTFAAMAAAALGVVVTLGTHAPFPVFLAVFLVLFVCSGVGNGSTFRMVPAIFNAESERLGMGRSAEERHELDVAGRREAAAVLAFSSAVAAYGSFLIPQGYSLSLARTGGYGAALLAFVAFYLTCLALTWRRYLSPARSGRGSRARMEPSSAARAGSRP